MKRSEGTIYAAFAVNDAGESRSAKHPELEVALEHEDEDQAWAQRVTARTRELLHEDRWTVDARCAQTFCRLRITRPLRSGREWSEIDRLLYPVAEGETIFQTEDEGQFTTAYVYFSAKDSHLPLADIDATSQSDDS